jgi:uncharacterized protein with NRDE domain
LATRVWPEAPLVVAANRDEALDRPSGPPRRYPLGERSVLAPEDKVGGGTWLGVNDQGLFVGITNRFGLPKDPAGDPGAAWWKRRSVTRARPRPSKVWTNFLR